MVGKLKKTLLIKRYFNCLLNPSTPFFAHFFITTRCNLRCPYCGVWKNDYSKHENTELSKKIIDKIYGTGVVELSFTGGEPLLRGDIYELINYASDLGLWTQITSNGTMDEEMYKKLAESKIDFVSISLDSLRKEEAKADPDKIIGAIKTLNKNGKKPNISCILNQRNMNIESIKKVLKFAKDEKCSIMLCPVVIKRGEKKFSFRVSGKEYEKNKVNEIFDFLSQNYGNYPLMDTMHFLSLSRNYMLGAEAWRCKGTRFYDIMPDGTFGFCQDFLTKQNILDDDFDRWFKEERLKDAKKIIFGCEGCVYSCYPNTEDIFSFNVFHVLMTLIKARF